MVNSSNAIIATTDKANDQVSDRSAATPKKTSKRSKHNYKCKALDCTKFRQGRCNGYCLRCFAQFGATTCKEINCISDKLHANGYCKKHFVAATTTVVRRTQGVAFCIADGCTKFKRSECHGYCRAHYHQLGQRPQTPKDLYDRIVKSRDKLFLIALDNPAEYYKDEDEKKENQSGKMATKSKWHLVRVDLDTCRTLDETKYCEKNGMYYVEFFSKASSDKALPDDSSRWWLQWHEYYRQQGKLVMGNAVEINPNSKKAIKLRLRRLQEGSNAKDLRGEEKNRYDYPEASFDKNMINAVTVNLMKEDTILVGPFSFEDADSTSMDVDELDDETKLHFEKLYVKDRIGLGCWEELIDMARRKDIVPPTISKKKRAHKKVLSAGKKRNVDEVGERRRSRSSRSSNTLHFPATSSLPQRSLRVDNSNPHTVSKDELLSMVDSVLEDTRSAKASDGTEHYLVDELKDNLMKAFSSSPKKRARAKNEVPIQGIPEDHFTADEIAAMPIVFAYHCPEDDPKGESEQNARIAQLDYEVEQRRLKRNAKSQAKSPPELKGSKPVAIDEERMPAEEFPSGWTKQHVPRSTTNSKVVDTYYYSPNGLKFRSRPEVNRFLALLEEDSDMNEETAYDKLKRR